MSIGYACIIAVSVRSVTSHTRGPAHALYLLTTFNGGRYEFIFTVPGPLVPRIFSSLQAVSRAYAATRTHRELVLRGSFIRQGHLVKLRNEHLYEHYPSVINLSGDQGSLGNLCLTSKRVIWWSAKSDRFNMSIPYMQIAAIRAKDSKFGPALVVVTCQRSGSYVLGFRADPKERQDDLHSEMVGMWQAHGHRPDFGVEYVPMEEVAPHGSEVRQPEEEEGSELIDAEESDAVAAYYADSGGKSEDRKVAFSKQLGLAIEAPEQGISISSLWRVV